MARKSYFFELEKEKKPSRGENGNCGLVGGKKIDLWNQFSGSPQYPRLERKGNFSEGVAGPEE